MRASASVAWRRHDGPRPGSGFAATAAVEVKPARTHLLAGEPAPSLLDEIARANPTLVAVGPRGHSRAAGMRLGGVAARLLHEASCSVLLARAPAFGEFPSSIIVGVDGSPESLAAAAVAKLIAERKKPTCSRSGAAGSTRPERSEASANGWVTEP